MSKADLFNTLGTVIEEDEDEDVEEVEEVEEVSGWAEDRA